MRFNTYDPYMDYGDSGVPEIILIVFAVAFVATLTRWPVQGIFAVFIFGGLMAIYAGAWPVGLLILGYTGWLFYKTAPWV